MTDDGWSSNEAKVVCRQLGYSTDGETLVQTKERVLTLSICGHPGVQATINAYFGQGIGSILLENVTCSGSETSLLSCAYTSPSSSDSHSMDAGVKCPGQ